MKRAPRRWLPALLFLAASPRGTEPVVLDDFDDVSGVDGGPSDGVKLAIASAAGSGDCRCVSTSTSRATAVTPSCGKPSRSTCRRTTSSVSGCAARPAQQPRVQARRSLGRQRLVGQPPRLQASREWQDGPDQEAPLLFRVGTRGRRRDRSASPRSSSTITAGEGGQGLARLRRPRPARAASGERRTGRTRRSRLLVRPAARRPRCARWGPGDGLGAAAEPALARRGFRREPRVRRPDDRLGRGGFPRRVHASKPPTTARQWTARSRAPVGKGGRDDDLTLPETRIALHPTDSLRRAHAGRGFGIREIIVRPLEFSASPNDVLPGDRRGGAAAARIPASFSGEQTYWTRRRHRRRPRGGPALDEDGALEFGKGGFSVEPFLYVDGDADRPGRRPREHAGARSAATCPSRRSPGRRDGISLRGDGVRRPGSGTRPRSRRAIASQNAADARRPRSCSWPCGRSRSTRPRSFSTRRGASAGSARLSLGRAAGHRERRQAVIPYGPGGASVPRRSTRADRRLPPSRGELPRQTPTSPIRSASPPARSRTTSSWRRGEAKTVALRDAASTRGRPCRRPRLEQRLDGDSRRASPTGRRSSDRVGLRRAGRGRAPSSPRCGATSPTS